MIVEQVSMTPLPDGKTVLTIVGEGDRSSIAESVTAAMKDPRNDPYEVDIKRVRKGRSLDANAYAWVLIDKIASSLGVSKSEVYREAVKDVPGVSTVVCVQDKAVSSLIKTWKHNGLGWQAETMPSKIDGCTNVVLYYGSSVYDSKQMSSLIDQLITECKQLKIETLPPDFISRLREQLMDNKKE